MDPDAALQAARDALAQLDAMDDPFSDLPEASDLADAFRALDEWLSKGGFRPAAWVHG